MSQNKGNNAPKAANNVAKSANNVAKSANNVAKASNNAPKAANNVAKAANNLAKAANNVAKAVNNGPKAVNNGPKAVNNAPKAANNVAKASNNVAKASNAPKQKFTQQEIKEQAAKLFERVQENKKLIIFCVISLSLLMLAYFYSKNYRVSTSLYNMRSFRNFLYINSKLNTKDNLELKLGDFHIASAFRPYLAINQLLEYCSLDVMKHILSCGVRSVYIDVFNSSLGSNAEPVISSGFKTGQWKLSLNTLKFDDVCHLISSVVFSAGYVNNPEDPFILCLNLNTNGNIKCLNKMKKTIFKRFKRRLLDNSYTYSSKNMAQVPIKELFGKLIIFCSDGYQNSDLEELVNYSWDKPELKKISYHALDPKISKTSAIKMNAFDVLEYNKNNMTIVTPSEQSYYTYNYHSPYFLDAGCQLVMMNYQKVDKQFEKYLTFFKNDSFVRKAANMRGSTYSEKIKMNIKKTVLEDEQEQNPDMSEKCPERPTEDYLAGDDGLYYKSNNSNDLGLCFVTNGNCNCDNSISKLSRPPEKCNNTLWNQSPFSNNTQNTPTSINNLKLCCSTRRINNPLARETNIAPPEETQDLRDNPGLKYFLSKTNTGNSNENNCTEETFRLEDGAPNFSVSTPTITNSNTTNVTIFKCPVTTMEYLEDKQICLLDRNGNSSKKCPDGWKYNGKLDSETYNQDINICCRNN